MSRFAHHLWAVLVGTITTSALLSSCLSWAQPIPLVALPDGNYQVCSEPEPTADDWHDGNGVCFVFEKIGEQAIGYYGYPHTDSFICLRGNLTEQQLEGEALFLSWAGRREVEEIPEDTIAWDDEGHLILSQGELSYEFGDGEWRTVWFWFHQAVLDLRNFYQYSTVRMNDPANLCPWNQDKLDL